MLLSEIVQPPQHLLTSILYHGTPTKSASEKIIKNGLEYQPELIKQKYKGAETFAPLHGVYLTKEFGNGVRYSFMAPNDQEYAQFIKHEPIGYVFEFSGGDLTQVTPDEDELGEVLNRLVNASTLPPKLNAIVQQVPPQLKTALQVPDVSFEAQALAGKWIINHLSPATIQYLMKRYHNVVNYGNIKPIAVWTIPKPQEQFLTDRQGTFNTHGGYVAYAKKVGTQHTLKGVK